MSLERDRLAGYAAAIHSGYDMREYSDFSSDIDLEADSPGPDPYLARGFIVMSGSGNVVVATNKATRTITGGDVVGVFIPCAIKTIKAATAVDRILVIW